MRLEDNIFSPLNNDNLLVHTVVFPLIILCLKDADKEDSVYQYHDSSLMAALHFHQSIKYVGKPTCLSTH